LDFTRLVVNWDIGAGKTPDGKIKWIIKPAEKKTLWRPDHLDVTEDPGKEMHPLVVTKYKEYLKTWRPVLTRSLGERAVDDTNFREEDYGPGAAVCFTLFPGFWAENQKTQFRTSCFQRGLGCSERTVRKALTKTMNQHRKDWGITKEAVAHTKSAEAFRLQGVQILK
jgi:hypothetical protein